MFPHSGAGRRSSHDEESNARSKRARLEAEQARIEALPEGDRDPYLLRQIGHIQPHGVLIAVREDLTVTHVSANVGEELGVPPGDCLGRDLADLLAPESYRNVRDTVFAKISRPSHLAESDTVPMKFFTRGPNGAQRKWNGALHVPPSSARKVAEAAAQQQQRRPSVVGVGVEPGHGLTASSAAVTVSGWLGSPLVEGAPVARIVIELEKKDRIQEADTGAVYIATGRAAARVHSAGTLETLCQGFVDEVSDIIRMDRVMVYRFDALHDGEVVAEAVRATSPCKARYLGMSFPGMDIPPQARELFCRNRVRQIPDFAYEPVAILAAPGESQLDLQQSILRGVSPCHRQYMKNMRTRASLVNAIVVESRLWGLVVCHQADETRYWSYKFRLAFNAFVQAMSSQIAYVMERSIRLNELRARDLHARMLSSVPDEAASFLDVLVGGKPNISDLINCAGAALIVGGTAANVRSVGRVPRAFEIVAIWRHLCERVREQQIWWTSEWKRELPATIQRPPELCGILVARAANDTMIMFFRDEVARARKWAGAEREVRAHRAGVPLTPRDSFELWVEYTKGQSEPFREDDCAAVNILLSVWTLNEKLGISNKRLRCVTQDLQKMISAVTVPVFACDTQLRVTEWNPKSEELFHISAAEVRGRDFVSLVVEPSRQGEVYAALRAAARGEQMSDLEFSTRGTAGAGGGLDILLRVASRIDESGAIVGIVGIGTDLTERKSKMKAEIRAEEARKFLATMSHEMRTPLNGILGMLQLAKDFELPQQLEECLAGAMVSGEHLLSLISAYRTPRPLPARMYQPPPLPRLTPRRADDVLDISKLEAGKITFSRVPLDIEASIRTCLAIVSPRAREKGLPMVLELPLGAPLPRFLSDPERLQQVLLNYLSNAVKFTPAGEVRVRVWVLSRTAETWRVRFEVQDTGPGIRGEDRTGLFQRFHRVHGDRSSHDDPGGTGLGLAICKEIVERWGGELGCDSVYGEGSTFWFCIPLDIDTDATATPRLTLSGARMSPLGLCPPARASLSGTSSPASGSPRPSASPRLSVGTEGGPALRWGGVVVRALVVEDNATNMRVMRAMLEKADVQFMQAADGAEAVDAFRTAMERMGQPCSECGKIKPLFTIVFMDMEMPRKDGLTATQEIRALEGAAGLPRHKIVALTGHTGEEEERRCLEAGMDARLTKPLSREILLNCISQAVEAEWGAERCSACRSPLPTPAPRPPVPAAPSLSASPAPCTNPCHVLIVEDNPMNMRVLTGMVERAGHRVSKAADGAQALDFLMRRIELASDRRAVDLIFMDVQMPVMDGHQAMREIRRVERERGVPRHPIVAVTAFAAEEDRRRCLDAGADDFTTKPVARSKVLEMIDTWGSHNKEQRDESSAVFAPGEGESPRAPEGPTSPHKRARTEAEPGRGAAR
eukprot:tig00021179_g19270.t1